MFAGMAIGGALVGAGLALGGHSDLLRRHPGVMAPVMATNMSVAMVAWMRHRGHSWAATVDMVVAMYASTFVFLIPFLAGVLAKGPMFIGMHLLMLPAMWAAMVRRRDEYTHEHRAHVRPFVRAH
jgi:hypothetical protein